jgi:hypothetical protein
LFVFIFTRITESALDKSTLEKGLLHNNFGQTAHQTVTQLDNQGAMQPVTQSIREIVSHADISQSASQHGLSGNEPVIQSARQPFVSQQASQQERQWRIIQTASQSTSRGHSSVSKADNGQSFREPAINQLGNKSS